MQPTGQFEPLGFGVGSILNNRYELVRKLGSGGMSVVYEATDRALNNDRVALKIFSPSLLNEQSLIDRFHQEVLITRKMTHPNIVRTFEFGQMERGGFFLTMECVSGVTLEQVIHETDPRDRPSFAEIVRIICEICKGVGFAHSQGVVHRDLKPANILVSEKGDVKLTDFGLARALMMTNKKLTQVGECVGTPFYMAPEQVQEQGVDARSDIYSIGIIAYEMLTGHPPFESNEWFELASQIMRDPMPNIPRKVRAPQWFKDFVMTAAAKHPDDRFQNTECMIQILLKHAASESTINVGRSRVSAIKRKSSAQDRFRDRNAISFGIFMGRGRGAGMLLFLCVFLLLGSFVFILINNVVSSVSTTAKEQGVSLERGAQVLSSFERIVHTAVKDADKIIAVGNAIEKKNNRDKKPAAPPKLPDIGNNKSGNPNASANDY